LSAYVSGTWDWNRDHRYSSQFGQERPVETVSQIVGNMLYGQRVALCSLAERLLWIGAHHHRVVGILLLSSFQFDKLEAQSISCDKNDFD
jgi:hypothetical protein